MEEKRLNNYLSMSEHDLTMYLDETSISYTSVPIGQVQTVDPLVFYGDIGAPHSCIGDKALERIIRHSRCRSISIIDSKHDFRFGDTSVRSRGKVELMLPTSGSTPCIPVILDVLDV